MPLAATAAATPTPAQPPESEGAFRRSMWSLAIAETLVWAGLYYSFPALIARFEADLGWSKTELAVAFTMALIISAIFAPIAGRQIDRGHGRIILTGSATGGGALLVALAFVETRWQFYGIYILLGFVMAGCLYEPCFAYIIRTRGSRAPRGITLVTLAAGFAGTVAFPVGNLVADAFDWRVSFLAFAGLIFAVSVPLFWFGTRGDPLPAEDPPKPTPGATKSRSHLRQTLAKPTFWLLAIAFALIAMNHGMLITHLLPLLDERNVSGELAVLTAAMIGPMQVAGRLGMLLLQRWAVSILIICGLTFGFMLVASSSLLLAALVPALLIPFVVLQGAGYGVTSITRPVVTVELLGCTDFGTISGSMAIPYICAFAVGPIVAAEIWELAGYDAVLLVTIALAGLGLGAYLAALKLSR